MAGGESGVICDRRLSTCAKGKVYKTVVRPAMLYSLETVTLTKKQEAELAVAELKMLRFSLVIIISSIIRTKFGKQSCVERSGGKAGKMEESFGGPRNAHQQKEN